MIRNSWFAYFRGRDLCRRRGHFAYLLLIPRRDLTAEGEITLAALDMRVQTQPLRIRVTSQARQIAERSAYLAGQDVLTLSPPAGVTVGMLRR